MHDVALNIVVAGHKNQAPRQSNPLKIHSMATATFWHPTSFSSHPAVWTVGYIHWGTDSILLDIMQRAAGIHPKLWH